MRKAGVCLLWLKPTANPADCSFSREYRTTVSCRERRLNPEAAGVPGTVATGAVHTRPFLPYTIAQIWFFNLFCDFRSRWQLACQVH